MVRFYASGILSRRYCNIASVPLANTAGRGTRKEFPLNLSALRRVPSFPLYLSEPPSYLRLFSFPSSGGT